MIKRTLESFRQKLGTFDWVILVFILMMSQDRIVLKLAALVFIYLLRFNLKFRFADKRLPLFYLVIILYEVLKYLFMGRYLGNWATLFVSSLYWIFAFLALHQICLSVEKNGVEKSENTIKVFTIINFAVCMYQLLLVMVLTGSLNPYSVSILAPDLRFPDVIFPYGQSSGDQIRGVFYDNHHNAIISQFCFVFFLFTRRYWYAAVSFFLLCIICFNLITMVTILFLVGYFVIVRDSRTRIFISSLAAFVVIFYLFITPENIGYLKNRIVNSWTSVLKSDSTVTDEQAATPRTKNPLRAPSNLSDSSAQHSAPIDYINKNYNFDQRSGKKISYDQTYHLMTSVPLWGVFGCGAGMFSSKLANNFSGVFYGPTILNKNLPAPNYDCYNVNHGSLNRYLQKQEIGKHSINNFPNSVYNQLLSEYGIIGLLLFLGFYVFFFIKRYRHLTYGLCLVPLLLIAFNYGYYFESLDITLFFEFLMFLNLHTKNTAK